jgi:hypothetical protein
VIDFYIWAQVQEIRRNGVNSLGPMVEFRFHFELLWELRRCVVKQER